MDSIVDFDLALDRDFERRMNEAADKRYEYELTQLELEDNQNFGVWRQLMKFLQVNDHLGRMFLSILGELAQVDVYGGYRLSNDGEIKKTWVRSKTNSAKKYISQYFDERYASLNRFVWTKRLILILYYSSVSLLIVNIYFQYKYDYHLMRQQSFKAIVAPGTNTLDVSKHIHMYDSTPLVSTIKYLRHQETIGNLNGSMALRAMARKFDEEVEKARHYLDMIGSPYVSLHFVVEVVYYTLVLSISYIFDFLRTYYKKVAPFDHSLLRSILDWKHERRLINGIVLRELDKIIQSSRNFTNICVEQAKCLIREMQMNNILLLDDDVKTKRLKQQNLHQSIRLTRNELKRQLIDHLICCNHLKEMAIDGTLMPRNRSRRWIRRLNESMTLFCILFLGYAYGATISFAFAFFILAPDYDIELAPNDLCLIAAAGVLICILVPVAAFYISLVCANSADQILYVMHVRRLFVDCIGKNDEYFRQNLVIKDSVSFRRLTLRAQEYTSTDQPAIGSSNPDIAKKDLNYGQTSNQISDPIAGLKSEDISLEDTQSQSFTLVDPNFIQMNKNLLEAFMHYKIFKAQMRANTHAFGPFVFGCLILMTTIPVSLRLHSSYLNDTFKVYAMIFCLVMVSVADIVLLPLCYLYSRCLDLHRCLSSLLAHTVEVTNAMRHNQRSKFGHKIRGYTSDCRDDQCARKSQVFSAEINLGEEVDETRNPTQHENNERVMTAYSSNRIYDAHTIWLLRKELIDSDQMVGQFVIYAFGVRLTYGNILRLHFWVSLFTLSMIVSSKFPSNVGLKDDGVNIQSDYGSERSKYGQTQHQTEFLTSLLNDPFGVFEL